MSGNCMVGSKRLDVQSVNVRTASTAFSLLSLPPKIFPLRPIAATKNFDSC